MDPSFLRHGTERRNPARTTLDLHRHRTSLIHAKIACLSISTRQLHFASSCQIHVNVRASLQQKTKNTAMSNKSWSSEGHPPRKIGKTSSNNLDLFFVPKFGFFSVPKLPKKGPQGPGDPWGPQGLYFLVFSAIFPPFSPPLGATYFSFYTAVISPPISP